MSPQSQVSDDRLRAFLVGLEMQHVDELLAIASVDDMRKLGETMAAQIKSAIDSVPADQVVRAIRSMQEHAETGKLLSPLLLRQWIRDLAEKLPPNTRV